MVSTQESVEQKKCVPHGNPTLLRCATCDTPVCPRCGRITEVGQKCLGCAPLPKHRRRSPASRIASGLLFLGAAVALVAAIGYVGSDAFQQTDGTDETANPADPVVAPVGSAVTDQASRFSVEQLHCTEAGVGGSASPLEPGAKHCLVRIRLENVGDAPIRFRPSAQRALVANNEFAYDEGATAGYATTTGGTALGRTIAPGDSVTGSIVFTLSTRESIDTLEFHEIANSPGAMVRVRQSSPTVSTTTARNGPFPSAPRAPGRFPAGPSSLPPEG